jgi:hypothetical protein
VRPIISSRTTLVVLCHPSDQSKLLHANPESPSPTMKAEECKVDYLSSKIHHEYESHQQADLNTSSIPH